MIPLNDLIENLVCGDDHRAEESARSFPAYGEDGLQALKILFAQPEADVRWWALRALAGFSPTEYPEASRILVDGLQDPEISVQTCAAVGLREQPNPEAVPHLIKLLEHEDTLLARTAGDALIALKKSATPALVEMVQGQLEDHSNAKVEAVRALAMIGDPASISTLFKAWEQGSSMVQHWAERGLNDMGIGMAFFNPGG
jgi:HEAT repeat protein